MCGYEPAVSCQDLTAAGMCSENGSRLNAGLDDTEYGTLGRYWST